MASFSVVLDQRMVRLPLLQYQRQACLAEVAGREVGVAPAAEVDLAVEGASEHLEALLKEALIQVLL